MLDLPLTRRARLNAHVLGSGGEEDDQDWETVADSHGPSRRGLQDIEVSAGIGSSHQLTLLS